MLEPVIVFFAGLEFRFKKKEKNEILNNLVLVMRL